MHLQATPPIQRIRLKTVFLPNGCWQWTAYLDRTGHGEIHVESGKRGKLVHRYIYELLVGTIPDEFQIHHLCENPGCINPSHLTALSQRHHLDVTPTAAAYWSTKPFCKNGHPQGPNSRYTSKSGRTKCKKCQAERGRRYLAKRKSHSLQLSL